MYNVKTSRLLFLKRNRMLIKVPPGFLKSWRDIFNYSPMDFIYWRMNFIYSPIIIKEKVCLMKA
jgi:hypothetical protein